MATITKVIGSIALVNKGAYNSTTTYKPLNMVRYSGAVYTCKSECTGVLPTNTSYWELLINDGSAFADDEGNTQSVSVQLDNVCIMYITDSDLQSFFGLTSSTNLSRYAHIIPKFMYFDSNTRINGQYIGTEQLSIDSVDTTCYKYIFPFAKGSNNVLHVYNTDCSTDDLALGDTTSYTLPCVMYDSTTPTVDEYTGSEVEQIIDVPYFTDMSL